MEKIRNLKEKASLGLSGKLREVFLEKQDV
jgi:hypothetical protein